jgi:hypothetical protein
VLKEKAEEPFFAKVVESQKAFAKRVVSLDFDVEVEQKMAYDHFFKS